MHLRKISTRITAAFLVAIMVLTSLPFSAAYAANTPEAQFAIETIATTPGETIELIASLENASLVKSMAISDIVYDTDKMALTSVQWLCDAEIKNWNSSQGRGVLTFGENTDANGPVLKMTFKIQDIFKMEVHALVVDICYYIVFGVLEGYLRDEDGNKICLDGLTAMGEDKTMFF